MSRVWQKNSLKEKCLWKQATEQTPFLSGPVLVEVLRSILAEDAEARFKVKGFSMFPFIRDEDIVTVSPLKKFPACLGRPVAFVHPCHGQLVIHRVVGSNHRYHLIKGDNIFATDGYIPKENILGSVSKIERRGRQVYFPLGPERLLVVFLSKTRLLNFLLYSARIIIPRPLRNILKSL